MGSAFPPSFHPSIGPWFLETYGQPTAVQAEAWPRIAAGDHVLALAPTGSGKTLAAFLDAVSRFALGEYDPAILTVLYVSPLKALNEDIRRNLQEPLESLRAWFERAGEVFPDIRVETRSGDTPASDRRRFLVRPPSILATTPESLAILLASPRARPTLSGIRLLILDEIHAVLDSKRGAFLACQVGALSLLAGEFRRIALSATVRTPEPAENFVGGWRRIGTGETGTDARYEKRPVVVVAPPEEKKIELTVEFPEPSPESLASEPGSTRKDKPRYGVLMEALSARIRTNRSTLVFTDSRRRAERIAFLLNEGAGAGTAYAHHGSLSKEVRRLVEERLKQGGLPCVVATGSLELGIDIGAVDEVVLAGAPPAVAPALQRIGRSGHGVGRTSRGTLFPFHGMDLLRSAALAGAIRDRDIESPVPIENPLDILAQTILALCATESRNVDSLYRDLVAFPSFHGLSRAAYDRVVEMLAGRYESSRLRDLKPRLRFDKISGTLSAADGLRPLLYSSGGAIPDRGVYALRLADGTRIGELDEEFVWERRIGDAFSFGTRSWRILAIGPEAVEVAPLGRPADFVPFWKAETRYRSPVLVRRTLELTASFSSTGRLDASLEDSGVSGEAREALKAFLKAQLAAQGGVPLPGPGLIPLELCSKPDQAGDFVTAILHTLRGGAVNEPLALALAAELEESVGLRMEAVSDEDSVLVVLPLIPGLSPDAAVGAALGRLGDPAVREDRLRGRLEASGVFGAAFREAAGRSLLLPRAGFGKRTPLWITRLRAKRLFEAVRSFGDFPMIEEAWRTCLTDLFDMEGFDSLLGGIAGGDVRLVPFRTRAPSPFAREAVWQETNRFLYEGDAVEGRRGSSLSDRAITDAIASARLRPALDTGLVSDFAARLRRERPGWAPDDGAALEEWVKERTLIPEDEWRALEEHLGAEARAALASDPSLGLRIAWMSLGGTGRSALAHEERRTILETDPVRLLGEWLRYEGPTSEKRVAEVFGLTPSKAREALDALSESGTVTAGVRLAGSEAAFYCDSMNLELLLRRTRKSARPSVEERPLSELPLFLAELQGLGGTAVRRPWETLSGWTAPLKLWETELLPARLPDYRPENLDAALSEGLCLWFGAGKEIVGLCPPEDLDLAIPDRPSGSDLVQDGFSDFWNLRDSSGLSNEDCARALWKEAWKGAISSDTWESLRASLSVEFGRPEAGAAGVSERLASGRPLRIPRALRDRWKGGPPVRGRWFSLAVEGVPDPLEREGLDRERVRVLAGRWGVLCRPLLEKELPAFGWSRLLPALRRLELAGELLAGRFFADLGGLQFMTPEAFDLFLNLNISERIFWMNACDPASLAGVQVGEATRGLPPRIPATRLCYKGGKPAVLALRKGRELRVELSPDDADLPDALTFLKLPRTRAVAPERKLVVETVNGLRAVDSPYARALGEMGFERDRGRLVLW